MQLPLSHGGHVEGGGHDGHEGQSERGGQALESSPEPLIDSHMITPINPSTMIPKIIAIISEVEVFFFGES